MRWSLNPLRFCTSTTFTVPLCLLQLPLSAILYLVLFSAWRISRTALISPIVRKVEIPLSGRPGAPVSSLLRADPTPRWPIISEAALGYTMSSKIWRGLVSKLSAMAHFSSVSGGWVGPLTSRFPLITWRLLPCAAEGSALYRMV